jgi:tetratricopeptide (TPR) repeat protein
MLHNLGVVMTLQGDRSQARCYLEQSLVLHRDIDNKHGIGLALIELGSLSLAEKDYDEAKRLYNEAQDLFEKLGEKSALFAVQNGLALVQLALQPDDPKVGETFRQSLKDAREINDSNQFVGSVLGLAKFLSLTNASKAAELIGWVLSYPHATAEHKTWRVGEIRPKLEEMLSADALQEALQRGQNLTEDQMVQIALVE